VPGRVGAAREPPEVSFGSGPTRAVCSVFRQYPHHHLCRIWQFGNALWSFLVKYSLHSTHLAHVIFHFLPGHFKVLIHFWPTRKWSFLAQ